MSKNFDFDFEKIVGYVIELSKIFERHKKGGIMASKFIITLLFIYPITLCSGKLDDQLYILFSQMILCVTLLAFLSIFLKLDMKLLTSKIPPTPKYEHLTGEVEK